MSEDPIPPADRTATETVLTALRRAFSGESCNVEFLAPGDPPNGIPHHCVLDRGHVGVCRCLDGATIA